MKRLRPRALLVDRRTALCYNTNGEIPIRVPTQSKKGYVTPMNQQEQEKLERYLQEKAEEFPADSREEKLAALREKLTLKIEETGSLEAALTAEASEEKPQSPSLSQEKKRFSLLSPESRSAYSFFVKITILASALPIFVITLLEGLIGNADLTAGTGVGKAIVATLLVLGFSLGKALLAGLSALAAVTLLFLLIDKRQFLFGAAKDKSENEHIRRKKNAPAGAAISWSSTVATFFTILIGTLLIFSPEIFSISFRRGDVVARVPLFNLTYWNRLLPLLIISLLVCLSETIYRMIKGHYSLSVLLFSVFSGAVQLVADVVLLKVFPLWNSHLASDLQRILGQLPENAAAFVNHWNPDALSNILLSVFVFFILLSIGTTLYQTLHYRDKEPNQNRKA